MGGRFRWKKSTLAAAAAIALCFAATGTLAALTGLRSANPAALAAEAVPGVNLHDDFAGGPEKDVYAENSGSEAMLTRIRLTELLELSNGTILPLGASDNEAGTGWHRHAPNGTICTDCGFEAHRYFTWDLGGHKLYMPAAPSALAQGDHTDQDAFLPPKDVGDTLAVIDYAPLLRDAFSQQNNADALALLEGWLAGDGAKAQPLQKAIAALPDSLTVSGVLQYTGQPEAEQTRRLNEVRLTGMTAGIVSMEEWERGGRALGDFWVMDSDGWCYWARKLSAGEATGQLLQACAFSAGERGMLYKIRAELDAVTTKPEDINAYLTQNKALGDVTESGILLTLLSSGSYTYGADQEFYLPKGDNTFVHVLKNEGSYANYILGQRVCAEADQIPGSADDLKPGQGVAVHRDGTLYRILNEDGAWTPDGNWAGPYQITDITSGENGTAYLALEGGGYCCSVASLDPASASYLNPTTLGLGPYRLVWPGEDGIIGTGDDLYNEDFAAVGSGSAVQFYRRLTQKVYIRVAALGDTAPALYLSQDGLYHLDRKGNYINEADLTPVTGREGQQYTGKAAPLYYAAGAEYQKLEDATFALEAMTGTAAGPAALTYNYLDGYKFQFLLGSAFKFTQGSAYLFPADADYAASARKQYELTPTGVVRGGDERFYLRTEVTEADPFLRWYIGPGSDDILGTADDVPVKAGPDLVIGTEDDGQPVFKPAPLDFLPADFTGTAGETFTADGAGWVVVNNDGAGNLLIAATDKNDFGKSIFNPTGGSTDYEGSQLQSYYQNTVMPRLTQLKEFVQPADIPASGLSVFSAAGVKTAFPLSNADVRAYQKLLDTNWNKYDPNDTRSYYLRSPSSAAGYPALKYVDGVGSAVGGNIYQWNVDSSTNCRPAMIVNFGDLDFGLPYDFTGLPGDRLWADGYDWVVLHQDAGGNLMLMTVAQVAEMGARSDSMYAAPAYGETLWVTKGRDTTFTGKLAGLRPYAMAAEIPDEPRYPYKAAWNTITDGRSTCAGSADGATAFVLSAGEYSGYLYRVPGMRKYCVSGNTWALRSCYSTESAPANPGYAVSVNGRGEPYDAYANTSSYPPRMTLWVNFGLTP